MNAHSCDLKTRLRVWAQCAGRQVETVSCACVPLRGAGYSLTTGMCEVIMLVCPASHWVSKGVSQVQLTMRACVCTCVRHEAVREVRGANGAGLGAVCLTLLLQLLGDLGMRRAGCLEIWLPNSKCHCQNKKGHGNSGRQLGGHTVFRCVFESVGRCILTQ